jgi:hypothetical protein
MRAAIPRAIFACMTAFLSASLGDALLESVSNSGILWRGHFTDSSSIDIAPMLLLSALVAAITLASLCRLEMRRRTATDRALLPSAARVLARGDVLRLLPVIVVLELATLFGMETVEQIVVYGHALGGTLWLGAPPIIGILLHAALAVTAALCAAKSLTVLAPTVAAIVDRALLFLSRASRSTDLFRLAPEDLPSARWLPVAAPLGERGPPLDVVRI